MQHSSRFFLWTSFLSLAALVGCAANPPSERSYNTGEKQTVRERNENLRASGKSHQEASALNVSLGQAYLSKGQLDLAMDKLQKAVALDPKSSDAHTVLAVLYEQLGNNAKAEEHYLRAQKLAPAIGSTNNNLGRFLCAQGKFQQADERFAAALADPFYRNPETALVNRATCALKNGKRDIAESSLRTALQRSPNHSDALLQMAQLAFNDADLMRARAFLERHLSVSVAAPDTLLLGLKIEKKLGDQRASENYRKRLLRDFPQSEQAAELSKLGE